MTSRTILWAIWIFGIGLLFGPFLTRGYGENLLQQVRFGYHGDFSRVVFDLQKHTTYQVLAQSTPSTVLVEFEDLSLPSSLSVYQSRDPLIRAVRFVHTAEKTRGEIELKQPGRVKKHFRMDGPPRIVVDIFQEPSPKEEASEDSQRQQPVQHQSSQKPQSQAVQEEPRKVSTTLPRSDQAQTALTPAQLLEQADRAFTQEQFDEAQQLYTQLLKRYPHQANAHLIETRLADILRAQKHYLEALKAYATVVTKYPASEGAVWSQIHMAELSVEAPDLLPANADDRYASYTEPIQSLLQLSKAYPLSPFAGLALLKMGTIQLAQNDPQAALETFQHILDNYKDPALHQEALEKLAQTVERLLTLPQEPQKILTVLEIFFRERDRLQKAPLYPDLLFAVAKNYAQLGLEEEAQSILQQLLSITLTPQLRAKTALLQAILLFQSGQLAAAKTLLTPLEQFREETEKRKALLLLGKITLQEHHPQETLQYLGMEGSMFSTPEDRVTLFYLRGKAYQELGEKNHALDAFRQCAENPSGEESAFPSLPEQCLFQVGDILLGQNKPREALEIYQTILDRFPQSTRREWTLFQIAHIYRQLHDEQGLKKTLTLLREHTNSPFWQAIAMEQLNDFQWRKRFDPLLAEFQKTVLQ